VSSVAVPDDSQLSALRREREAFAQRVRESERLAAADPLGYRRKLKGLVALGYFYISVMVALAVAVTGGIGFMMLVDGHWSGGGVKILFVGLFFVYAVVRSLWVKLERPGGLLLAKADYPQIWQEVEAIADRLKAPRPNEIRLDEDFNASAAQWPRFGVFGGYRETLTLGFPLLAGLSLEEARGVIAHEFGHFSGEHGRFGVWIYRVNQTWRQLEQNLAHAGWSAIVFKPFVDWFFPRFAAASFAIRRQHEFEADMASVEVVGAPATAQILTRINPLGDHLQRTFWKNLERDMGRSGATSTGFASQMVESMRTPMDPEFMGRAVAFSAAQATDYTDTHPSLSDRLAAIGETVPTQLPSMAEPSALEALFGVNLPRLQAEFETYFGKLIAPALEKLALQRLAMTQRVRELEKNAATLDENEQVVLEFLRIRLAAPEDPIPAYRELLGRFPASGDALYLLGSALLEEDEEEGVALVQAAAEKEPRLGDDVRGDLAGFYARRGEAERFEALREEALEAQDRASIAEGAEGLSIQDELLPPEFSPLEEKELGEFFDKLKGLGVAYAVRKRMPGTGENRVYLVLMPKAMAFTGEDPLGYFTKQFAQTGWPPIPATVVALSNSKRWRWRLNEVKSSLIFDAKAS
jgi:Zn-dependent protease with chaperone function